MASSVGSRPPTLAATCACAGMAHRLWTTHRDHKPGEPLFATVRGEPRPPRESTLRRDALEPAREAAGLEWVTFHSFRHSCASLLFQSGKNIRQVSDWLGHADPAFTLKTYVHLIDGGLGDVAFLDAAVAVEGNAGATPGPPTAEKCRFAGGGELSGKPCTCAESRKHPQTAANAQADYEWCALTAELRSRIGEDKRREEARRPAAPERFAGRPRRRVADGHAAWLGARRGRALRQGARRRRRRPQRAPAHDQRRAGPSLLQAERKRIRAFLRESNTRAARWQARTRRQFELPRELVASTFGCTTSSRDTTGACADGRQAPVVSTAVPTYVGTYQPWVYVPTGVAMRAAGEPRDALRLGAR